MESASIASEAAAGGERNGDKGLKKDAIGFLEEHAARAIVVGTYGENPVKGAILGSTPYKLMQVAERPVLVVPVI